MPEGAPDQESPDKAGEPENLEAENEKLRATIAEKDAFISALQDELLANLNEKLNLSARERLIEPSHG